MPNRDIVCKEEGECLLKDGMIGVIAQKKMRERVRITPATTDVPFSEKR
ncbi:hypothetical protein PAJ34TS1_07620 [Paenibacillus azoreducens]